MATNCIIGMVMEDGSVEGITCHWGGRPSEVGETLVHCYGEEETKKLMALGAISTLGEFVEPPAGVEHSFKKPYPGVTVSYQRDRGDAPCQGIEGKNIEDFLYNAPSTTYAYLLEDGDWVLHVANDPNGLRLAPSLMR